MLSLTSHTHLLSLTSHTHLLSLTSHTRLLTRTHTCPWAPAATHLGLLVTRRRFWRYVTSRSESERALLLKFCSGSTRVPCGGFSQLLGLSGPCRFTLACVGGGDERLPSASTCFNMLKVRPRSRGVGFRRSLEEV
jgi:hypothetical protein